MCSVRPYPRAVWSPVLYRAAVSASEVVVQTACVINLSTTHEFYLIDIHSYYRYGMYFKLALRGSSGPPRGWKSRGPTKALFSLYYLKSVWGRKKSENQFLPFFSGCLESWITRSTHSSNRNAFSPTVFEPQP